MRKFINDIKGAVTIFVTLLLIPIMLVSGTAVDLARIYATRSVVQDANQLAANSLLTQYDALLNDVYGLFGIMQEDHELGSMLAEYIQVAIIGEVEQNLSLGSYQLFYGSNVQDPNVRFINGMNLQNPHVLRRQIEDYMKLRAPLLLFDAIDFNILELIDSLMKLVHDSATIGIKLDIDNEIERLEKEYERVYTRINNLSVHIDNINAGFSRINACLTLIKAQFEDLLTVRNAWESADNLDDDDPNKEHLLRDHKLRYDGIIANISSYATGGRIRSNWINGYAIDDENWMSGRWGSPNGNASDDLRSATRSMNDAIRDYNREMDRLITAADDAERIRQRIERKVENLKRSLDKCSGALQSGFHEPVDNDGNTLIGLYEAAASHNVKDMVIGFRDRNASTISNVSDLLDSIGYGRIGDSTLFLSTNELTQLSSIFEFSIDFTERNRQSSASNRVEDVLPRFAGITQYSYAADALVKFNNAYFTSIGLENVSFYEELTRWFSGAEGDVKKNSARTGFLNLLKAAQQLFGRLFLLEPMGANYYRSSSGGGGAPSGDWGSANGASDFITSNTSSNSGFMRQLANLSGFLADELLLLTYATNMFSNFSTKVGDDMLSDVPMDMRLNYFFQSEQELMFHGNFNNAKANIAAVVGTIFLIRIIFNYISTFVIKEIRTAIMGIKAAFAWTGPFAIVISELARLAWAFGESVIDVVALIYRQDVPLFKYKFGDWYLGGIDEKGELPLVALIRDVVIEAADDALRAALLNLEGVKDTAMGVIDDEWTVASGLGGELKIEEGKITFEFKPLNLSYDNYMFVLLLLVNSDDITNRISWLISLNMTNYSENIYANEARMSTAALFDMSKVKTDFEITTTVDMRMLFLSMIMAQNFSRERGIGMPTTVPISATDNRGY